MIRQAMIGLSLVGLVGLIGCAAAGALVAPITTDVIGEITCIVNGAEAGQTVEQVALNCGGVALVDIVNVLSATQTPVAPSTGLTGVLQAHPTLKVVVKAPVAAKHK
jgi:hypothetical protein